MPFTWSSMKPISSSTNAWRLPGTPAVAPRTTHQMKPSATTPRITAVISESTLIIQKPPASATTGFEKKVRWCSMYSEGVSSLPAAAIGLIASVVADKKRHGEYQHRDHERSDQDADRGLPVVRQHEPQHEHGKADLDCLGTQRAEQNPLCGLRVAPRSHERGRQSGNDADQAAGGRRYRSRCARKQRGGNRHCSRCRELPSQNRAYRLAQLAKHGVSSLRTEQNRKIIHVSAAS